MSLSHICRPGWLLVLLALTEVPGLAQEKIPAPREEGLSQVAADLQCVPNDAALMVSLNVGKIWRSKAAFLFRTGNSQQDIAEGCSLAPLGLLPCDIDRITLVQYRSDLSYILRARKPLNQATVVRFLAHRAHQGKLKGKPYYINEESWTGLVFLDDRTILVGTVDEVEGLLSHPHGSAGPLSEGIAAAVAGRDLVIAANPQKIARLVDHMEPALRPLMQAGRACLTAEFEERKLHVEAGLEFTSAQAAQAAERVLRDFLDTAKEMGSAGMSSALRNIEMGRKASFAMQKFGTALCSALRKMTLDREGGALNASLMVHARDSVLPFAMVCGLEINCLPGPSQNHDEIHKLGLAMLEYHRKFGRLPGAAICGADGQPLLSWRVSLLPFLGQGELFKQFHLDEPWDSEHNRKLIAQMPEVFRSSFGGQTPTTDCQVFVGKGAAFEGKTGKRLRDFKDGPEQTILIAHSARRVPWSKPEDMHYSADKPIPALNQGLRTLVLADGQVVTLPGEFENPVQLAVEVDQKKQMTKNLRALITRSGGDKLEAQALLTKCAEAQSLNQQLPIQQIGFPTPTAIPTLNPLNGLPGPYPTMPLPPPYGMPAMGLPGVMPPGFPPPPAPGTGPGQPNEDRPH